MVKQITQRNVACLLIIAMLATMFTVLPVMPVKAETATYYLNEDFDALESFTVDPSDKTKWNGVTDSAQANAVSATLLSDQPEAGKKSIKIQPTKIGAPDWKASLAAPQMTVPNTAERVMFDMKFKLTTTDRDEIVVRNSDGAAVLHFNFTKKDNGFNISYVNNADSLAKDEMQTYSADTWYRLIAVLNMKTLAYEFHMYDANDELVKSYEDLVAKKGQWGASAPSDLKTLTFIMYKTADSLTIDHVKVFSDPNFELPEEGTDVTAPPATATPSEPSETTTPSAPSETTSPAAGEIVIHTKLDNSGNGSDGFSINPKTNISWDYTKAGTQWVGSSYKCADNTTSTYYTSIANAYAQYTPANIQPGNYKVSYWAVPEATVKGTVTSNGNSDQPFTTEIITSKGDTAAWVDVGTFYFSGEGDEYIRVGKGTNSGTFRVSSVKLERQSAAPAAEIAAVSTVQAGQKATIAYTYTDADGDTEAGSTYILYSREPSAAEWTAGTPIACKAGNVEIDIPENLAGKVIRIGITPKNDGEEPKMGAEVFTDEIGPLSKNAEKPEATQAAISGDPYVGNKITASYTYTDVNNDPENGSTYQWLSADSEDSSDWDIISSGTCNAGDLLELTITEEMSGKYIAFSVTPKNASAENSEGDAATSNIIGPVIVTEVKPGVSRIELGGQIVSAEGQRSYQDASHSSSSKNHDYVPDVKGAAIDGKITVDYTYTHESGTAEDTTKTKYQWYTSFSKNPQSGNLTPIAGATSNTYTPTEADAAKYVIVGIKPVDANGIEGDEVFSEGLQVKWKLGFADEFEYEADDANDPEMAANWWSDNAEGYSEDFDWGRYPTNVRTRDGYLETLLRKDEKTGKPNKPYSLAFIKTKKSFGYGYYEARLSIPAKMGVNNAFWLITDTPISKPHGMEIDWVEAHYYPDGKGDSTAPNGADGSIIRSQVHENVDGAQKMANYWFKFCPEEDYLGGGKLSDDFHTYGGYWSETEIAPIFDGQFHINYDHSMVGNTEETSPEKICFSNAKMGWAGGDHWTDEYLDQTDENGKPYAVWNRIDYIRYFEPLSGKGVLESMISSAEELLNASEAGTEPGQYPQAAVDALTAKVNEIKNAMATMDEAAISNALTELSDAMNAFTAQQIWDTAALKEKVAKAGQLLSDYPAGSGFLNGPQIFYDGLRTAKEAGDAALQSPYPTQEQVETNTAAIETAIERFMAGINYTGTANSDKTIDLSYTNKKAEFTVPANVNPKVILPAEVKNDIIITRQIADKGSVKITIPRGAQLQGEFKLPTELQATVDGYTVVYGAAMNGIKVTSNNAIRIEFSNSNGAKAGTKTETVSEITQTISADTQEAALNALGANENVLYRGSSLVVYTKDLGDYIIYRENSTPTPSPTDDNNNNNNNNNNNGSWTPGGGYPGGIVIPGGNNGSDKVKFNDITGHWAEEEIRELAKEGIVKGRSETEYEPEGINFRVGVGTP